MMNLHLVGLLSPFGISVSKLLNTTATAKKSGIDTTQAVNKAIFQRYLKRLSTKPHFIIVMGQYGSIRTPANQHNSKTTAHIWSSKNTTEECQFNKSRQLGHEEPVNVKKLKKTKRDSGDSYDLTADSNTSYEEEEAQPQPMNSLFVSSDTEQDLQKDQTKTNPTRRRSVAPNIHMSSSSGGDHSDETNNIHNLRRSGRSNSKTPVSTIEPPIITVFGDNSESNPIE
ncbi:hypothetical protein WICPIJ_002484, partial [Wickerhamomyces pijperi]